MGKLTTFLKKNKVANMTKEVIISERIVDENGKPIPFTITNIPNKEFTRLQDMCTKTNKKGKVDFNSGLFSMEVIKNFTVEPSFKDVKLLEELGCTTPEAAIEEYLLAGEIAELSSQISKFSGFDQDLDELKQEAKN